MQWQDWQRADNNWASAGCDFITKYNCTQRISSSWCHQDQPGHVSDRHPQPAHHSQHHKSEQFDQQHISQSQVLHVGVRHQLCSTCLLFNWKRKCFQTCSRFYSAIKNDFKSLLKLYYFKPHFQCDLTTNGWMVHLILSLFSRDWDSWTHFHPCLLVKLNNALGRALKKYINILEIVGYDPFFATSWIFLLDSI